MFTPWVANCGRMGGGAFAADRLCSGVVLFGSMALVASFVEEGLAGWLEVISGVQDGDGVSINGGRGGCGRGWLLGSGGGRGGRWGSGWFLLLCVVGC